MEKITEKLLLEKGSPKTNKLDQIKTLNLSRLGLKLQDLPVKLLSRLQTLERWDLSKNRLQEFPKNLKLPALRYLDLSDNQIEDVTTLESLSSLEEVKMEDNIYMTVSDNYKLMSLLPNLRIYNGKDISTAANHVRYVYTENLMTRMIAVWEKNFGLPDPITAEKMATLETDFVNAAKQQVKFGPSSVSDFTKWKELLTPRKRKQSTSGVDTNINLTPRKRLHTEVSASPVKDSPRKSSLRLKLQPQTQTNSIRMSPCKSGQPPSTSTRAKRGAETPRKLQQTKEDTTHIKQKDNVTIVYVLSLQPVSLKPLHVLQCHSKQDSSEDFSTQLWTCAFQPLSDSEGNGGGSRLVATCGGDSLCVIDCETGMVMKKYKVPGEEFFSLAWSTVLMSRGGGAPAQPCKILAAGGKRGLVKLIHPRNNVAYGEFRASRKALSVLRFNHHRENFLFTGSYDNKIVMWDIGGVDSNYNFKVVQLLMLEIGATPLHICLLPASPSSHLLTACEDGLHCFNTQLGTNNTTKRQKDMEITFPIYEKEDKDHDYHTIDGLNFLTDDIVASKNYMHGSIYLWSWSRTKSQRPNKKSRTVCAVVLAELQWTNTEIPYLALNTCPGQAYIVCGDDKGRIWTYHIPNLHKSSLQTGKPILPTEVLEWPTPVSKDLNKVEGPSINSVAMDPELQYLVALSDKNMVIVWKREDSS
uniref:Leucine-rich repeat and WD repeat-containing protein 1 n=1 Tax=Anabas testudineus TaxID=64144 RepID=A0A7N6C1M8_ANATE